MINIALTISLATRLLPVSLRGFHASGLILLAKRFQCFGRLCETDGQVFRTQLLDGLTVLGVQDLYIQNPPCHFLLDTFNCFCDFCCSCTVRFSALYQLILALSLSSSACL